MKFIFGLVFSQMILLSGVSAYECERAMVKYQKVASTGFKNDSDLLELYVSTELLVAGYKLDPRNTVFPGDLQLKIEATFGKGLVKNCEAKVTILRHSSVTPETLFERQFLKKLPFGSTSECAWKISRFIDEQLPKCD